MSREKRFISYARVIRRKSDDCFFRLLVRELIDIRGRENEEKLRVDAV